MKLLSALGSERYILPVALALLSHRAPCVFAQEPSIVGTPQETNERIRQLSETTKSSAMHDYVIGDGDLLSISVFDVPELSREVRVSQNGTVSIPLVPARLHVSGLTEVQAEQKITDVLEANGLVSHPEVGVTVKEHRSKPITIVGAVLHPMVYEADHSVSLLEAIAQAGGIANDAGDTIIVTRNHATTFIEVPNPASVSGPASASPGDSTQAEAASGEKDTASSVNPSVFPSTSETGQHPPTTSSRSSTEAPTPTGNIITVNLNELLEKGDARNNIPLQSGDIVTVPHAGIVYVLGAVNRPGGFVVSNDRTQLTALKVLALAGGFTKIAKIDHAVIIRRDDQGKQTETEVDLKKIISRQAEDLQMRASDIFYIPESRGKQVLVQTLQLTVALATSVAVYRLAYH